MKPTRFHGPRDYLDAALDPSATADELRELASSEYDFVRVAVANHLATPADALSGLFGEETRTWNQQAVLLHLANNPDTPPDILERIAALIPGTLHDRDAHQAFAAGVALFRRQDVTTGGRGDTQRRPSSSACRLQVRPDLVREGAGHHRAIPSSHRAVGSGTGSPELSYSRRASFGAPGGGTPERTSRAYSLFGLGRRCRSAGSESAGGRGPSLDDLEWRRPLRRQQSYTTAADLAARCHRAALEGRWATTMRFFAGPRLLIVDEVGYLPMPAEAAAALFQVVSQGYLKGSVCLTTNRSISSWGRSSTTR